ncbi:hypothetical protein K431DRAFT_309822 [Polychaeton citri CBS 116435]|uniref:Uncharacterized protein n=1 Tax=Polychaeton citri CBS 116435 TaxID=1314669 RepID=A0A9P4QGY1_9PEZI|nr:hypothetical protein K431DRAFT_309822 [Polychaeton citri CBS 116435]
MDLGYKILTDEIIRIVASPYPIQLKTLRIILLSKCDSVDVIRWTASNSCKFTTLASRVLEALPRWPYVLDIVTKLCADVKIRNAFLEIRPCFLADIVKRAVEAEKLQPTYLQASIALLSRPLPPEVSLPADAQSLFTKLFSDAAENPSPASLKSAYTILNNSPYELYSLLSEESLSKSEDCFDAILRDDRPASQCLKLYCLAISHLLTTAFDQEDLKVLSASSFDTQDLLSSSAGTRPNWKPDTFRKLFSNQKGATTLQLLTFRAYSACRQAEDKLQEENLECLQLVNQLVLAIPRLQRRQYAATNIIKTFIAKILAKVQDSSISFIHRASALYFAGQVVGLDHKQPDIEDSLRVILSAPQFLLQPESLLDTAYLLETFDAILEGDIISQLMSNILNSLGTPDLSYSNFSWAPNNCLGALERLEYLSQTNPAVLEGVAKMLEGGQTEGTLQAIVISLKTPLQQYSNCKPGLCKPMQFEQFASVAKATASLCLKFSFRASPCGNPAVIDMLVEILASSSQIPAACNHRKKRSYANTPSELDNVESRDDTEGSDWRAKTSSYVAKSNQTNTKGLIDMFAEACRDLETRCESIEAPLQLERLLCKDLKTRNDGLHGDIQILQRDKADLNIACNAMKEEANQLVYDLSEVQGTNGDLHHQITQLEEKHSNLREETDRELDLLKGSYNKALLEQHAMVVDQQEQMGRLAVQCKTGDKQLQLAVAESKRLKTELDIALSSSSELQSEFHILKSAVDDERMIAKETREIMQYLARNRSQLEAKLERSKQEMDQQKVAHAQEISKIQGQTAASTKEMAQTYQREIENATSLYRKEVDELSQRFMLTESELHQERERYGANKKQWKHKLDYQQRKTASLTRKLEVQKQQVAEAEAQYGTFRTHIEQMMQATSGGRTGNKTRLLKDTQEVEKSSPPTSQRSENDEAEHTLRLIEDSFGSNSSNTSRSGPTPKRPRSRKSRVLQANALEATSFVPSGRRASLRSSRANMPAPTNARRQPLVAINANRSPIRSTQTSLVWSGQRKRMSDCEESDFDGNDIFTTTQIEHGRRVTRPSRDNVSETEL